MSGVVGIVDFSGEPISRSLLDEMTASLAFRGPDRQGTWVGGGVGFGHTLLVTTDEAAKEDQPFSLDAKVWITADARIDDRERLTEALKSSGQVVPEGATDPELVLRAYAAWGTSCVDHLLGDFAFAIWDTDARRLFCARDHLGVKPFFYARLPHGLVFSNTLKCLRRHAGVSDELDELAVADFLLFRYFQDLDLTIYRDVRRLPPAHVLVCDRDGLRVSRYWTLSEGSEVRRKRPSDYVDEFTHVLELSVRDRLRTNRVGIYVSGGLDSACVAVTATSLLARSHSTYSIAGFTGVFDRLIPDEEREFSSLVTERLQMPHHFHVVDDYRLYEGWQRPEIRGSTEPEQNPRAMAYVDQLKATAQHSRVLLTGWDGDVLFRERPRYYFSGLLRRGRVAKFAYDLFLYWLTQRRLPRFGLRTRLKQSLRLLPRDAEPAFPDWLNPDFSARLSLESRWRTAIRHRPGGGRRPTWLELKQPNWPNLFNDCDSGETGLHLEVRHPLLDLRVVQFAQSLPAVPWCTDKTVVREAMRGVLPERVRLRPKTPLLGDATAALARLGAAGWDETAGVFPFEPVPEIMAFVDGARLKGLVLSEVLEMLSVTGLNFWLRHRTRKTRGGFGSG